MENLLLTVNIVFPIFLVMAVGYFCRHSGMLNAEDIVAMNRVSFGVFLPASLCHSLLEVEAGAAVSPGVLAFGFAGTLVVFLLAFLIVPRFERDDARRGVIIQGIFRSNYAIFGIPLSQQLFPQGDGGVAAMMVIATIPLFNALGVACLESFRGGRVSAKRILSGIVHNPLIWGCAIGYALMQLRVPVPEFAMSTLSKLADVSSPLALFVLGGSINLKAFQGNFKRLSVSVVARLVAVPLAALAVAYALGFRGVEFAVLMIVFGSPCAVSSYTMAAQMGGDAELAAQQVMVTTVLSAVTMFAMIFLFKTAGVF